MSNKVGGGGHDTWGFCFFLANLSTSSLPSMFVYALTLQMVILWDEVFTVFMIRVVKL